MAEAPENTRAAFDRALERSVDGIEFDVQLSRDGVPVIFHDKSLRKINRSSSPVSHYTYEELSQLDWGGWFSKAFSGEPILTLDQVLLAYGGKIRLLAEIKAGGANRGFSSVKKLAEIVPERIRALVPQQRWSQMVILSFSAEVIALAAASSPEFAYGQNLLSDPFSCSGGMQDLPGCLTAVSLPFARMTAGFVRRCHQRRLLAMTYSCNTPGEAESASQMGIDVIMTDDPASVNALAGRR
ncbi:MAG: glycerophosphodiester phosphodiesterase family protein [Desulfosalsimonadaceae bacterium]